MMRVDLLFRILKTFAVLAQAAVKLFMLLPACLLRCFSASRFGSHRMGAPNAGVLQC